MDNDIPKKAIDIGIEPATGEPNICLDNREQDCKRCCDGCEYFSLCFPKVDHKSEHAKKTFKGRSSENIELFKQALCEGLSRKFDRVAEAVDPSEIQPPSKRHKREMNRIFRELLGSPRVPYPEEDEEQDSNSNQENQPT